MTSFNGMWMPHGMAPNLQTGGGKSQLVCVAEVEGVSGRRGACGNTIIGNCCGQQQFHKQRPKPFVQQVADGDHLAQLLHVARPYAYSTGQLSPT